MTSAKDSGDAKLRGGKMNECIQSERRDDVPRGEVPRDHSWEVNEEVLPPRYQTVRGVPWLSEYTALSTCFFLSRARRFGWLD